METIIKKYQVYNYSELDETAKEKVKKWLLDDETRNEIFKEDKKTYLIETFPKSDLKIEYSLNYCQGDGLNIYGHLSLFDFLNFWDASEKEKRTVKFYIQEARSYFKLSYNNHYTYSCKFLDLKNIDGEIEEQKEFLKYNGIKNIKTDILKKFYIDMLQYFENLDNEFEKDGYNYLYEISEEETTETCNANGYTFLKDGTPFTR